MVTAPDIFAVLVHIHTGVLLVATHRLKPASLGETVSKQGTSWVLPPHVKLMRGSCSKL